LTLWPGCPARSGRGRGSGDSIGGHRASYSRHRPGI